MDDCGSDAVDLKLAFNNTMKDTYEIPLDYFVNLIIPMCADGASVNMGIYTGACTQIKKQWSRLAFKNSLCKSLS